VLYRWRGHKRALRCCPTLAAAGQQENAEEENKGYEEKQEEEEEEETERWWVEDDGEAAFDSVSLVDHHMQLPELVREGFRQQARNLRWFAARALGLALSEPDESIARLFAVAQANTLALSDPSSLHPIGRVRMRLRCGGGGRRRAES